MVVSAERFLDVGMSKSDASSSTGSSMTKPPDLKSTLNLPRTAFPMKANLPQSEPKQLAQWDENRLYQRIQEARAGAPAYRACRHAGRRRAGARAVDDQYRHRRRHRDGDPGQ